MGKRKQSAKGRGVGQRRVENATKKDIIEFLLNHVDGCDKGQIRDMLKEKGIASPEGIDVLLMSLEESENLLTRVEGKTSEKEKFRLADSRYAFWKISQLFIGETKRLSIFFLSEYFKRNFDKKWLIFLLEKSILGEQRLISKIPRKRKLDMIKKLKKDLKLKIDPYKRKQMDEVETKREKDHRENLEEKMENFNIMQEILSKEIRDFEKTQGKVIKKETAKIVEEKKEVDFHLMWLYIDENYDDFLERIFTIRQLTELYNIVKLSPSSYEKLLLGEDLHGILRGRINSEDPDLLINFYNMDKKTDIKHIQTELIFNTINAMLRGRLMWDKNAYPSIMNQKENKKILKTLKIENLWKSKTGPSKPIGKF